MDKSKELEKKEREILDKIFEKFGSLDCLGAKYETAEAMKILCKHFDDSDYERGWYCTLAEAKCESVPSRCIYRKVYAKAVEDMKKKLENDDF